MPCRIELFDVRGDYPLKTGQSLACGDPAEGKAQFEQFRAAYSVDAVHCTFVAGLNFEESLAAHFYTSVEGFTAICGEPPAGHEHYKQLRQTLPPLSIAEQRNLKEIYRQLSRSDPARAYDDSTVIEEMVLNSSGVTQGLSRCSNCNLPMHVNNPDDHRCLRCGKENLCSFCMTSHDCR